MKKDLTHFREAVREFALAKVAPHAAQIDRDNDFPAALWRDLGEAELLGITVERKYGGSNLGYLAHLIATEELSRASASVGLSYAAHSNLCVDNLYRHGSENQRQPEAPFSIIRSRPTGFIARRQLPRIVRHCSSLRARMMCETSPRFGATTHDLPDRNAADNPMRAVVVKHLCSQAKLSFGTLRRVTKSARRPLVEGMLLRASGWKSVIGMTLIAMASSITGLTDGEDVAAFKTGIRHIK
jgi:hypothetical protein